MTDGTGRVSLPTLGHKAAAARSIIQRPDILPTINVPPVTESTKYSLESSRGSTTGSVPLGCMACCGEIELRGLAKCTLCRKQFTWIRTRGYGRGGAAPKRGLQSVQAAAILQVPEQFNI